MSHANINANFQVDFRANLSRTIATARDYSIYVREMIPKEFSNEFGHYAARDYCTITVSTPHGLGKTPFIVMEASAHEEGKALIVCASYEDRNRLLHTGCKVPIVMAPDLRSIRKLGQQMYFDAEYIYVERAFRVFDALDMFDGIRSPNARLWKYLWFGNHKIFVLMD